MVAIAVPTAVPVFDAIHVATERKPSRRHNALFSMVAAAITRTAATRRSASAHTSTTCAASCAARSLTSTPATNDRTASNS
jgi:hypothetical protein